MRFTYKKQLNIQKLILIFIVLVNPFLISSTANTKYSDKSEINKKLAESIEELDTDSKSINEAINEVNELIPDKDNSIENLRSKESKNIKKEDDSFRNVNLDKTGIDSSSPKNNSIQRKKVEDHLIQIVT